MTTYALYCRECGNEEVTKDPKVFDRWCEVVPPCRRCQERKERRSGQH